MPLHMPVRFVGIRDETYIAPSCHPPQPWAQWMYPSWYTNILVENNYFCQFEFSFSLALGIANYKYWSPPPATASFTINCMCSENYQICEAWYPCMPNACQCSTDNANILHAHTWDQHPINFKYIMFIVTKGYRGTVISCKGSIKFNT